MLNRREFIMSSVGSLLLVNSVGGASKRKCVIGYQPYCLPYMQANIIRMSEAIHLYMPKDVEIEWSRALAGVIITNDMVAGRTNLGLMGDSPLAIAVDKGAGVVIGATGYDNGEAGAIVIRDNLSSTVKDMKGLAGARIGVPFGSFSHRQLLTILKRNNITAELLNLDIRLQVSRLKNDTLEACCTWEPYPSYIESLGVGRKLITGMDVDKCSCMDYNVASPKHNLVVVGAVLATDSFLKENRDIAVGYMMAMEYANSMMASNPNLAAYYAWSDVKEIPQSVIRVGMDMYVPDTRITQGVKHHLDGIGKMWAENKLIDANFKFNYSDVVEEARKRLQGKKFSGMQDGFPFLPSKRHGEQHSWKTYSTIKLSATAWSF